jgi:hypothetical protein
MNLPTPCRSDAQFAVDAALTDTSLSRAARYPTVGSLWKSPLPRRTQRELFALRTAFVALFMTSGRSAGQVAAEAEVLERLHLVLLSRTSGAQS